MNFQLMNVQNEHREPVYDEDYRFPYRLPQRVVRNQYNRMPWSMDLHSTYRWITSMVVLQENDDNERCSCGHAKSCGYGHNRNGHNQNGHQNGSTHASHHEIGTCWTLPKKLGGIDHHAAGPRISFRGEKVLVATLVYLYFHPGEPILAKHSVQHICGSKDCIRPGHLIEKLTKKQKIKLKHQQDDEKDEDDEEDESQSE
ncbi:hypothetical protein DFA_06388 [Cavenderia fasciculata]|uniref:Zinc-binding loop region of homing endonuclease domain-containing protein n=1 Tax=Cavenderia fasciculata TaxID=261658 RepID=F4PIV4_CACFS|nr:uncharacterized protein DFA_06388 [Cavenderia fasciculata]EGG24240.1 hypothetical protein DFA_06388 [Cavenderia fasciculata]|eukprot:XP_004362091.1 hypothetical protein DFA_06388 [Cavenderia fasciculata]